MGIQTYPEWETFLLTFIAQTVPHGGFCSGRGRGQAWRRKGWGWGRTVAAA